MSFPSIKAFKRLSKTAQDKKKIEIIEASEELESILPIFMPEVFEKDYFFISYSHIDYKTVYKDLIDLQANGINTWYDRGNPAGKSWKEIVNKNMATPSCKGVIFYFSENSVVSNSVKNELVFAKEIGKPIVVICISQINGSHSLILSLNRLLKDIKKIRPELKEKDIELYHKMFPEEVIFLPISFPGMTKAEKILANIKIAPKLIISGNSVIRAADNMISSILEDDFNYSFGLRESSYQYDTSDSFSINPCAFTNCRALEIVDFGKAAVNELGDYSFAGCINLKSFNPKIDKITLQNGTFYGCDELKTINSTIRLAGTAECVFFGCHSLEKISVEVVESIGPWCFGACHSLKEIMFAETKNSYVIKELAFFQCYSLEEIVLPDGLTFIGAQAFCNCHSLKRISIPSSVNVIEEHAFHNCEVLEYNLCNQCRYLGNDSCKCLVLVHVDNKKIKTFITRPETKIICNNAFAECRELKTVVIHENVTCISQDAFNDCPNLTSIVVSQDNPYFSAEDGVLYNKDKTELITCLEGVKGSINIPSTVKDIKTGPLEDFDGFSHCEKLSAINVDRDNEFYSSINGILYSKDKTALIRVPINYKGEIFLPKETNEIWPDAIVDCNLVNGLVVHDENECFSSYKGLLYSKDGKVIHRCPNGIKGSVTIPSFVERISKNAFYGCVDIENLIFAEKSKLTVIDNNAFMGCYLVNNIKLPKSIRFVGSWAFGACFSLKHISIPAKVQAINIDAFYGCRDLESIIFAGTIERWNEITNFDFHSERKKVFVPVICTDGKAKYFVD